MLDDDLNTTRSKGKDLTLTLLLLLLLQNHDQTALADATLFTLARTKQKMCISPVPDIDEAVDGAESAGFIGCRC